MTLAAYVGGVGVLGPGLANWPVAAAVLGGGLPYAPAPTVLPTPGILPAAERRRSGRVVKLAIAVAQEATHHAGTEPALLATVFASSGGDGDNCHEICAALTLETRALSPTRFANSVHNAAAGYWSIGTRSRLESTVLCAFDGSFCAGLLEALAQVSVDGSSVLLVAYDTEYPAPLHAKRPIPDAFGIALVLTPERRPTSLARIEAAVTAKAAESLSDARLEVLRRTVPAARGLPLLYRLAGRRPADTVLDYLDVSRLAVHVTPCC